MPLSRPASVNHQERKPVYWFFIRPGQGDGENQKAKTKALGSSVLSSFWVSGNITQVREIQSAFHAAVGGHFASRDVFALTTQAFQ
jgi:hypothetical protein